MHHFKASSLLKVAAVVALVGLTAMCRPDHPSAPGYPHGPPLSAAQESAVIAQSRLPHGRTELNWVAQLHTRAMQEWMGSRFELKRLSKSERCARLSALVRSFLPQVRRASRGSRDAVDAVYERAITLAGAQGGCGEQPVQLSIWSAAEVNAALAQGTDSVISGAYEGYASQIEAAITTAATPSDVVARVDEVLRQASSLPAPDFEVLAAVGSLAASSAWYWYEYQVAVTGSPDPLSIFAGVRGRFSWRECLGADVAGGVLVVGTMRKLGLGHPFLLIAGFFGGAAIGSGIYGLEHAE